MMSSTKLSTYRQRIRKCLKQIETLAYKCAHADRLIRGTPGEVFRQCGKDNCRCAKHPDQRHGPYLVIQCFIKGKQKQIALKKDQKALWQKAKNYQQQHKTLLALKVQMKALEKLVKEVLAQRMESFPP